MKINTMLAFAAIAIGTLASSASAETGTYGRSKVYDIGNPGYTEESGCMDMPCCKGMKMSAEECAKMPCCKDMKMTDGACVKMMKGKGQDGCCDKK